MPKNRIPFMATKNKSPAHKQSNLECFMNKSNECIVIQESADEYSVSSPVPGEFRKSPTLLITPITKRTPPLSSRETTAKNELDLYVSLDALAIARNVQNKGTEEIQVVSPNCSLESPLTSPNVTLDKSKSATKRKPRKPKTKSEMDTEWDRLQEERKEVVAKRKEIDRIRAELEREREKLRKQIEKNEERAQEKEMKALERDAKLKRKEEMLDLKNREREMKLKLKETQFQEKENDRNRVGEERVREKDKKQAEQERFKNFFVPKPNYVKRNQNIVHQHDTRFVPFQLKDHMKLATFPSKQIDYEEFDAYLSLETHEFDSNTFLAEMKYRRSHNRHRNCQPMELQTQTENDIMIVTAGEKMCPTQPLTMRFKLLQFVENQRPAYFGTFFKRSSLVTGRRPFGVESAILDYEVDSDEEWEPDDPDAESIKSNDSDEDVSGSQNESDSEDGFFVPHGYLSEDEGHSSEENEDASFEKEPEPLASFEENRKQKLEVKEQAWLSEINQKCQPLKPFIISRLTTLLLSADSLAKINKCTAVLLVDDPLDTILPSDTQVAFPSRHKSVPDMINSTALPYFIQYIHEENIGVDRAVMQFCIFWNEHYLPSKYSETQPDQLNSLKVNKSRLMKTMHKIAKKVENKVWLVNEEFLRTDVLDVNVKNEIRKLFPSKTNIKLNESCTDKLPPTSPTKETVPKLSGHISSPIIYLFSKEMKSAHNETPQNDPKSIYSIKRKSLSEMRAIAVNDTSPISPPDTAEIKRVKLSTSTTSIEETDTPSNQRTTESRRLAIGVAQTDPKGACIHMWK